MEGTLKDILPPSDLVPLSGQGDCTHVPLACGRHGARSRAWCPRGSCAAAEGDQAARDADARLRPDPSIDRPTRDPRNSQDDRGRPEIDGGQRIVDAEGPIHVDEVARRVSAAFGKARTGGRIAAATLEALRHAGTAGQILRDDDFWMTDAQREDTPIRDRSAESRSILNVAALPGIEIRAAAKLLERESGRMESRAQVRAVARLLGFRQVRPDLQAAIQSALEEVPRDDVE